MIWRHLLPLIIIFFATIASAHDPEPSFVVNVIAHVPSSFDAPATNKELFAKARALPYFIEKDLNHQYDKRVKPARGKICPPQERKPSEEGMPISFTLGSMFQKLEAEAYVGSAQNTQAKDHISVAALLNRMRSVDGTYNDEFWHMRDNLQTNIQYRTMARLWQPQWKKEVVFGRNNDTRYENATFEEVQAYYVALKANDPELAQVFLYINEYQRLNSIVPYRELRELLMKSEATKSLVRASRTANLDSPVYMTFMDGDTLSFAMSGKGAFQAYSEAVTSSNQLLHGMTTGYGASVEQGAFVAMAVSLDLAIRRALSQRFPLASYFPEPNAAFRVLDGHETLEVSFPGIKRVGHHKYESPKEVPLLMQELVKTRFHGSKMIAAPHFRFLLDGEIETRVPPRFLQNRKGKDGSSSPKKYTGTWNEETRTITGVTAQDLINVRNTSQSHLKSRDWGGYVFAFFQELLKTAKTVRLVNGQQPGSVFSGRHDHFLTSLFASLQRSYSPVAITLREVREHGYNVLEYMFDLIKNYADRTPTTLAITYGDTGKIGTKNIGKVLRANVTTYEALGAVINKFFKYPVYSRIQGAAKYCGQAEIPILARFLQRNLIVPVPLVLPVPEVKVEPVVEPVDPEVPVVQKVVHPVQVFQYPKVDITFARVKNLIDRLYQGKKYTELDDFVGLTRGNCRRIANQAKRLSPNVRLVWQTFTDKTWTDVVAELSLTDKMMARITHSTEADIHLANVRNGLFLDTFFYLHENHVQAPAG